MGVLRELNMIYNPRVPEEIPVIPKAEFWLVQPHDEGKPDILCYSYTDVPKYLDGKHTVIELTPTGKLE